MYVGAVREREDTPVKDLPVLVRVWEPGGITLPRVVSLPRENPAGVPGRVGEERTTIG